MHSVAHRTRPDGRAARSGLQGSSKGSQSMPLHGLPPRSGPHTVALMRASLLDRIRATNSTLTVVLAACLSLAPMPLRANEFWDVTYLVGLTQGSSLTALVDRMSQGGYELSDATPVSFGRWYRRRWTDLHLDMMTQLSPRVGLLWGLSSGESGPKYQIHPGVKIGMIWQIYQNGNSALTLSLSTVIGGNLVEFPCIADYGAIGGVQKVNCRLAATPIPPKDTLKYLVRAQSPYMGQALLTYTIRF